MYVITSNDCNCQLRVSSIRTATNLTELRACLEEQAVDWDDWDGVRTPLREFVERRGYWSSMRVYESTPGAGNEPVLLKRERLIELLGL